MVAALDLCHLTQTPILNVLTDCLLTVGVVTICHEFSGLAFSLTPLSHG